MKKLYLSILLLVSMFLLVGCDSKKELDVTYQQANEMLESVNVEALAEEILTAKGKFNVALEMEGFMEVSGEMSFDLTAKITSLEDFYIIGTAKGNLNQKITIPTAAQTVESKFDLKIYIINNTLYVEGELIEGGSKTELKFKQLDVMDEATLQELQTALQGQTSTPDEPMLTEDMNFKMYKVKDGHLLEMNLTLEEILNIAKTQDPTLEDLPTGFVETGVNKLVLSVTFDDVIKKVDLEFEINFSYDMSEEMPELGFKLDISAKGEFHLATSGKAPTMPDMDVLNAYPEMEENPLLPPLFN